MPQTILWMDSWPDEAAHTPLLRQRWRDALVQAMPEAEWHWQWPADEAVLRRVQVVVAANPPSGRWQQLPSLALVQSVWAGVERLLADDTLPAHVRLARMVDPRMSLAMGETATWAVLSLHRHFFDLAAQQAAGQWQVPLQSPASEFRVGLLGYGELGRQVARPLQALGYPVSAWTRTPRDTAEVDGITLRHGPEGLRQMRREAQVLVNLLPLTADTRGLLAAPLWSDGPEGIHLVNLARGAHVVDADLLAALDTGQVGRAVLDVFHAEPLPAGHPFWHHPRVTVLPHCAAQTDPVTAAQVVARNLRTFQAQGLLDYEVARQRGY